MSTGLPASAGLAACAPQKQATLRSQKFPYKFVTKHPQNISRQAGGSGLRNRAGAAIGFRMVNRRSSPGLTFQPFTASTTL
jgi:hypothetical protein